MRRWTAVVLLFAGMALPACAQRGGGGHGGFLGHSAGGGFHGGFGSSAPSGFSAPRFSSPAFSSGRFAAPAVAGRQQFRPVPSFSAYSRSGFGAAGRAPLNGSNRYRRDYGSPYVAVSPYAYPYFYSGWGGWGSDFLDYPDAGGSDDSANRYAAQGYEPQPAEQDNFGGRAPYYASSPMLPNASLPPRDEDAVTLVFKDGRPPEQVHNYALTRTTLFVLDEHHRDIPVDQLDLAATEKVNRDAGIDFQLPVSLQ